MVHANICTTNYRARTRELPGNYPFVVQETFIKTFTKQWHKPAKNLCTIIHRTLTDHVKILITKHFALLGQGGMEQRVKSADSLYSVV